MIEYIRDVNRKPVVRHCADIIGAFAIYDENIGRMYVRRVTIAMVLHQGEAGEKRKNSK